MKIISLASLPEEGVSHNPEIKKRVILRRGDVPHLTALTQSQLKPGQVARVHRHAGMFEVFLVLGGSGRMLIDDREHLLEAGTCVAVEPGEAHEITSTGADDLTLLYFGVEE
jgi:mannose-6-phosphate isomerase-like protein (cupin superfamily)